MSVLIRLQVVGGCGYCYSYVSSALFSLGVQSFLCPRIQSGVASVDFCSPRYHNLAILFAIHTHLTVADFTGSATFMVRLKSMTTVSSKKSPGFHLITVYMVPAKYRNQTYLLLRVMFIKNVQN